MLGRPNLPVDEVVSDFVAPPSVHRPVTTHHPKPNRNQIIDSTATAAIQAARTLRGVAFACNRAKSIVSPTHLKPPVLHGLPTPAVLVSPTLPVHARRPTLPVHAQCPVLALPFQFTPIRNLSIGSFPPRIAGDRYLLPHLLASPVPAQLPVGLCKASRRPCSFFNSLRPRTLSLSVSLHNPDASPRWCPSWCPGWCPW